MREQQAGKGAALVGWVWGYHDGAKPGQHNSHKSQFEVDDTQVVPNG